MLTAAAVASSHIPRELHAEEPGSALLCCSASAGANESYDGQRSLSRISVGLARACTD
jgi:hypothetical protein